MKVTQHGMYILKDTYFQKYDLQHKMMDNKHESRPHYFAIELDSVLWMIPISSKVDKYKDKIQKIECNGRKCIYYHIGVIAGRECAFLIGDMIPVVQEHVLREYTISNVHYVVRDEALNRKITSKAKRFLLLARQGKIKPYTDILTIEKQLRKM